MITQCVDDGVILWASPASLVGLHFTRSSFSYWRMLHVTTAAALITEVHGTNNTAILPVGFATRLSSTLPLPQPACI
jgi:hypothetical protein